MPSVLLAIPPGPSFDLGLILAGECDRTRVEEVIEAARSAASSEKPLWNSGASSLGIVIVVGAMAGGVLCVQPGSRDASTDNSGNRESVLCGSVI